MSPSDERLVAAVRAGSPESFGALVARHDRRVRAYLGPRTASAGELEELVHQTFYLAFRHLARLDDAARFEAWLIAIAARGAREHARARAAERERARGTPREPSADPRQAPDWIWEEVGELSGLLAEVLHLRYRLSLSYREIAAHLGVPESTVRGRIHEARKALRARLDEERRP
jgi:RNA polymerase sigma-70 factor (ECF subfamily)